MLTLFLLSERIMIINIIHVYRVGATRYLLVLGVHNIITWGC